MTHPLAQIIETRFSGVLTHGAHSPDGSACLHEAINVARGRDWDDNPGELPDLRGLNDAPWSSDEVRTANLLPVGIALWDWADWSRERRVAFAGRVAEGTIREILPIALRAAGAVHPDRKHCEALDAAAQWCADEGTATAAATAAARAAAARAAAAAEAEAAAEAAAWAAEAAAAEAAAATEATAWAAAWATATATAAATAAARAAAARAAAAAEADEPLIIICRLLVEAAQAGEAAPA